MSRRLLPYEYQLIEALKVTEEEYLDFLAAQLDYSQSPTERAETVTAEPLSTVALVLTVVGVIFQVASALFAKPDQKNQRQRRQERFSPRFGFNTSQELAQYGDPVNLIYTSTRDNDLGGVRVATSLVWSSVESFGSSQFTQLLLAVGASRVLQLDPTRFAFGQLSLRQVIPSRVWIYYDARGQVEYHDLLLGTGRDPSRVGNAAASDKVCRIIDGTQRRAGFSQAFSPTSSNVFGVYNPIPIAVDVQERDSKGKLDTASLGVRIDGNNWRTTSGRWRVGDTITLVFAKALKRQDDDVQETAKELRYSYVESLDPASTYKLGTALFRLRSITDSTNLDDNEVLATFECLEAGRPPFVSYTKRLAENVDTNSSKGIEDRHFYTKCLLKIEEAVYQTVTACNYVKFAIRCRVFRNISGRAKKYGEKDAPKGYKQSDNGYKARTAFFKVFYKRTDTPPNSWIQLPVIFVARRTADQDNFIGLNFRGAQRTKWEFKVRPIGDMGAELRANNQTNFAYIENGGSSRQITHQGNVFSFIGRLVAVDRRAFRPAVEEERGPLYTNEWDLFSTRSDSQLQASFDNGPEFTITAVTEQQLGSTDDKYQDISMLALGVYSGLGMQDLRSVTGYVTEGKASYRVNENNGNYSKGERSTSWAPDIFADTILDTENGIGAYSQPQGVDWDTLALSKRFCMNSGLGTTLNMDGVIAEITNWRQFWAETAPYSLLEFARINGRETLVPAVPVRSNGRATREVTVSALFNQGNILEGTYREDFIDYGTDVQDLIATIIYRETEFEDIFPRNASVTIRLKDADERNAIRQTFDLSAFVARRDQAILYGQLLCNQRHFSRRRCEFQTVPTDSPVAPGAFILVDIGLNTWDRMTTGVVLAGGALSVPLETPIRPRTYSMLLFENGKRTVTLENVEVLPDGTAPAAARFAGRLFVLGTVLDRERVFRVSEVEMDEEGEVTIRASEYPCQLDGTTLLSRIANFARGRFIIT